MDVEPVARRRWYQFSLGKFLLLVALLAALLAVPRPESQQTSARPWRG